MISTVDPQARHVHKTVHQRQDGFKAHVAVEPDTGCSPPASWPRPPVRTTTRPWSAWTCSTRTPSRATFEVLGDSAYGTGDARAALAEAGHTAIIKPVPLRPAVAGGFTLDDFTIDEAAGTVTCPAGVTRTLTPARHAVTSAPPAAAARFAPSAPRQETAAS